MSNSYLLQSLELAGFRAYLQPKTFDFSKKHCMAIFAPNGNGKSSVIDALEFMFSKEGTLARLGQRAINNQAGPLALAHNLAESEKIAPAVKISVVSNAGLSSGSRAATGAKRDIPEAGATLNACFAVSPIIHGHELRTFVDAQTPEQRYSDVANWLQLGPLVDVQKNLRALRTQVKGAAENKNELKNIDTRVARETGQVVNTWETAAVLTFVNNSILAALALTVLAKTDATYTELEVRAQAEANKIGLAGLRQIRSSAETLWAKTAIADNGEVVITGAIPAFDAAVATLSSSVTREKEERRKAANTAFQAVWSAAEPLFADGVEAPEDCPVCSTPITDTTAGSGKGIRGHIAQHLSELSDYADAKNLLDEARAATLVAHTQLLAAFPGLIGLLGDDLSALKINLTTYRNSLATWPETEPPVSTDIVNAIAELLASVDESIIEIEAKQGEHTYVKAKSKIDRLLELQDEQYCTLRMQEELVKLSESLATQGSTVAAEIRRKVQSLLDQLQTPMNDIYKLIQGGDASTIRLELPSEEEANQQRLNLLIDFAENRTGVQPSGYLSDSQIHSVALALRMAAIKQFNAAAPIMALDDIVTSYDADHRRAIAGLIATMFGGFQILITTHDERFFNYLKDQLEERIWHFTRIISLDPTYGPRFADHKVSDEMIEARWGQGQSAANEMRQAEEEWLLRICRDFGVNVRIRSLEKAYSYERSELASALAGFLKGIKLEPVPVPGVSNRFLTSLAKGEIENFGSHFQDMPYGDGSIGDEKARWEEFKAFRNQFVCRKCNRTKFQRPFKLTKPVCSHGSCETQFEFSGPPDAKLA